MPYSTVCMTPLSNFEATQNYKDVNDPAGELIGQQFVIYNVVHTDWQIVHAVLSNTFTSLAITPY